MQFFTKIATLFAVAAALVAAHPAADAELAIRDTNTHVSEYDSRDFARKDIHKRKRIVHKNAMITYYYGGQLDNPACGGRTPSEWEAVAAVKLSHGLAKCGDELHVHWKGKMVNVIVVDDCGSCNEGVFHVDLSRGMFRKLDNLDVGVLNNAHVRVIHH
ncbi:unnamed protein product [Tilletia controversa]|uniref:RlpA-like protein double-psi beta-barrel domain-containing protein n=3 Tax=Tilletia TaxID=13289 RepID=A0A8X7MNQ8_9BASI|nr:hypothetical protein CF328_g5968 [Tilletia controversa]KAE8192132.1 hypothetical protein CF335_g5914 [Tilletia laevis]KAE8253860.1 hypothetical protein A4X03_0g5800 [Tilletia caries]KAE8196335.1 hypothetical protein CF336_g2675 [Tilletia laevis]KAE8242384.1 hypothetical protein A4X06_0g6949 [Tilletia controversa]